MVSHIGLSRVCSAQSRLLVWIIIILCPCVSYGCKGRENYYSINYITKSINRKSSTVLLKMNMHYRLVADVTSKMWHSLLIIINEFLSCIPLSINRADKGKWNPYYMLLVNTIREALVLA
jgi:hypothetical protein